MKPSWKVILAFTGIFLAGAVTGASVSYHWLRKSPPPPPAQGPRMSIEQFVRNQQDAMIKKLHLTEEQIVRITPILSQASQDLRKLHEQGSHLTIQILERQDSDILNILTPEQVKKFDQLRKEQRDRFEKNRKERMERLRKQPPQSGGQHGRKANEDTPAAPQAGEMEEPGEAPRPAINEPAPKT